MALSTTRKFTIGLLAVTALAVLFAGVAFLNINEVSARSGWVVHTNQVLLAIEDVNSSLAAAESGQRGYLITGQSEYLEPYFAVREGLPRRLAQLKRLVADNPRNGAYADTLAQVVAERLTVVQESIDTARRNDLAAGRSIVLGGRGKVLMDRARYLIQSLTDGERGLLEERLRQQRAGVERSRNIVTAGLGLTVLLCAVGAVTIITDHDARSRATAEILRLGHEAELAAARADEERLRAEDEATRAGDMAAEAELSAQEAADAMAEVARSEREMREFFENATVGLHWAGPDGIVQRVNRADARDRGVRGGGLRRTARGRLPCGPKGDGRCAPACPGRRGPGGSGGRPPAPRRQYPARASGLQRVLGA